MFSFTPSALLKPSPFYQSTLKEGVQEFTTYNNMLMPTGYGDPEGEYWRLIRGVSQWDVAVERQVQLEGPDAGRLAQILAPRDLSKCKTGQGKYVAICNHDGILINVPILLKVNEQCYWLSIADSNIWFWAKAIASERKLRVEVSEPDVSPMAIQGPKSDDVVASVCGDWVRELKYFWFQETSIEGIPVAVARSGWSKQRGFEIYLMDGSQGDRLWNIFREAGKPWDIGPGNPNLMERIESGLLSWGGDTDEKTNPFEVLMGKYVDLDVPDEVIGIEALRTIKAEGPRRHQLGLVMDEDKPLDLGFVWNDILVDGAKVGHLTNNVWSRRLEKNIGFALVSRDCQAGDEAVVVQEEKQIKCQLVEMPFI